MPITITINNVKSIKTLQFKVPNRGIYLLTGINGCGKTSLLASLYRMGNPNAFKELLKYSNGDTYDKCDGCIKYCIDNKEVTYTRKHVRWVPSPRKNTHLFNQTGYNSISFYPPNGERLYVHEEDLVNQRHVMDAEAWLKNDLNEIFSTQRFSNLRKIRVQEGIRGRRASNRLNIAYIIRVGPNKYYTEKNFSFGEILVLNLLLKLHDIGENELLLIDELEIALYPKALVALYKYLEKIAQDKKITIIISTHSASLINIAKKIVLLEPLDDGTVDVTYNCSAAKALGGIALQDDITPDVIIFVEDIMAKYYLKAIIKSINAGTTGIPDYRVISVGAFTSVIQFHKQIQGGIFTRRTKLLSLLDKDVEIDNIPYYRKYQPQSSFFQTLNELGCNVKFLPNTPEVGICQYIEREHRKLTEFLRSEFANQKINISECISHNQYVQCQELIDATNLDIQSLRAKDDCAENADKIIKNNGTLRTTYKRMYKYIVAYLVHMTQESEESINKQLFKQYVDHWKQNNIDEYNKYREIILQGIR